MKSVFYKKHHFVKNFLIIFFVLIILLNMFSPVYATDFFNTFENNRLLQDPTISQTQIDLTNYNMNLINNTMIMSPPEFNDVLSMNANTLNTTIIENTQELFPIDSTQSMLEQENLDKQMKDMMEMLNNDKEIIITGYVYKYEEISDNIDTQQENTKNNELISEEIVEVGDNTPEQNEEQQETELTTENEETDILEEVTEEDNSNTNNKLEEKSPNKNTEYYTILTDKNNEKTFIKLTTKKEDIVYFLDLVANQDILLEFVGELSVGELFSLNINNVTVIGELPSSIKEKFEEYIKKLNEIDTLTGRFISIDNKIYFLEEKTEKIHSISTELDEIFDVLKYIVDTGLLTNINCQIREDYLNILELNFSTNDLKEEELKHISKITSFDLDKIYNVEGQIIKESQDTYFIKVNDTKYYLTSDNEKIVTAIINAADTNIKTYIEGGISRKEQIIMVTYIEY